MEQEINNDDFLFNKYEGIEKEDCELENDSESLNEIIPRHSIFKKADPDKYLCIELKNNNRVYLKYDENWTIEEVYLC